MAANNKPGRKSNRKFNLDKESDKVANQNAAVEDESTQILGMPEPKPEPKPAKTKVEPTPAPIGTKEEFDPVPEEPEGNGKSSMTWMIWVCVIAIVALIIWWCLPKNTEPEKVVEDEQTEVVSDSSATDTGVATENTENAPAATPQAGTSETSKPEATPAPEPKPAAETAKPETKPEPAAASATTSKPKKAFKAKNSLDRKAMEVISGKKGNNPVRKKNLGKSYKKVQRRVNELKREGVF